MSDTPELSSQEIANQLWENIAETIRYYNEVACPCAFPRFRQYVAIDCVDYGGSFYFSETEGFITLSAEHFDTDPSNRAHRICKKCKSVYLYDWQDFSIHVNRQCMKMVELNVQESGAPALDPIPFHFGPVGHKNPERSLFRHVELEEFSAYTRELKP
jgi:hypothetical protein